MANRVDEKLKQNVFHRSAYELAFSEAYPTTRKLRSFLYHVLVSRRVTATRGIQFFATSNVLISSLMF